MAGCTLADKSRQNSTKFRVGEQDDVHSVDAGATKVATEEPQIKSKYQRPVQSFLRGTESTGTKSKDKSDVERQPPGFRFKARASLNDDDRRSSLMTRDADMADIRHQLLIEAFREERTKSANSTPSRMVAKQRAPTGSKTRSTNSTPARIQPPRSIKKQVGHKQN